ncbi:MAG: alkaline phosphatase family protein [Desulfurococcaceae archaeon]
MRTGLIFPALLIALAIASLAAVNSSYGGSLLKAYATKVVLYSIDAGRADIMFNLTSSGLLPGFRYIVENGYVADGMIVSFPSSTAVSHAVIATGAPPGINGITANSIHLPGARVYETVSGFNGSYLLAEPIWVTVDKQGLRAVVASFPQSTPPAWIGKINRSILFNPYDTSIGPTSSILYTTNTSVPRARYISLTPAANWSGSINATVYAAYESSFTMGDDTWYLYLAETNNDGYPDLLVIVPLVKDLNKAAAILHEGEWSKPINTTIIYGGSSYVVAPLFKALNLSLTNFRLYSSLMRPLQGPWFSSESIALRVWNEVVVNTGMITDGDYYGLTNDWFDEETFMETVYFTNLFFKEFTKWLIKNTEWNLLLTYTSIIDNVEHQFLGLIDPSMPYYDPASAEKYWNYIVRAYKWADEIIQVILENVDLDNTAVIVVSDHGQWSISKFVYINNILMAAGLLKVDAAWNILWNETKAYYVGHNQIFINLAGRERDGVVTPSEYMDVVRQVKAALSSFVDPATGEPPFSLVMSRKEAEVFGLFGDRAGDVVFSCRPGYAPSTGISRTGVLVPAVPLKTSTGTHSDLPYYSELLAVFGAVGAGVGKGRLGYIHSTSIAPTISALLGVNPPANATGTILPIIVPAIETTTVTTTRFETLTTTSTSTITHTAMEFETLTTTATVLQTTTATKTLETQITVTAPDVPLVVATGIVCLVIGVAISLGLLRKKK